MKVIDHVIESTTKYIEQMPKDVRKKNGQFFTSKETALFMASLFDESLFKDEVSILDPGTGSGILTVALLERLIQSNKVQKIKVTCYETNSDILPILYENLLWIKEKSPIEIEYHVREDNYITSQSVEYNNKLGASLSPEKFDFVIGNPPYLKIKRTAEEAVAMPDVCYGAPNLYFLFMKMASFNVDINGEMVFIIPRSWTSGAYFKRFREKFLNEVVITHIHLFVSRDKVFDKEAVLQETIIIKAKKTSSQPNSIMVTTTNSNLDFADKTYFEVPYNTIISGESKYVLLITDKEDAKIVKTIHNWKENLPSLGLKMKTGLTVTFRNKDILRNTEEEKTVPLFFPNHIKNGGVVFPIGKENEYIVASSKGVVQKNTNYLFVKRFTTKEEKRRLQCGIYLAKEYPNYEEISTDNKINFIIGLQELSECLVHGLYVIMNSSLYDKYYRILNGSTQVNATEINAIPLPPLHYIEKMGEELIKLKDKSEQKCDEILGRFIYE